MAYRQPSTPGVQQTARKPIRYSAHEVALMAQLANKFSPDFCRAATPYFSPDFLGFYLDTLVSDETPIIPPVIANALSLKQNRNGGFTWKVA
jgi:hypothetical protein